MSAAPVLRAHGLTRRFGRRVAVRDVSLEVAAGERVAVAGPNGAGKTTLVHLLAGVLEPTAGTVEPGPGAVGWVPQSLGIYGRLSVRENLALFARLERVPEPAAAVERVLRLCDLADRARDEVVTLSGGLRQRVNVAIGLLPAPPVLLLDEPSAALDPRQRERLWSVVGAAAGTGTAIVFTTHDLREAAHHADRLVVLEAGDVRFAGPPAQLAQRTGARDLEQAFVELLAD